LSIKFNNSRLLYHSTTTKRTFIYFGILTMVRFRKRVYNIYTNHSTSNTQATHMNIGIFTNSYPPNLNGVSIAVHNLQLALEKKGHQVFIATPKIQGLDPSPNICLLPSYAAPKHITSELRVPINSVSKATRFFREKKVDIIHSQDTIMGGMDAVLVANKLNIPCLHTYHTLIEDYEYFKFPGYKQFIRSCSQIVCDSHDAVLVLSDKIDAYLTEIGVSAKRYYLPNIFHVPEVVPGQNTLNNKFVSQHNLEQTFNIIIFGRVAKEKNIQASIDLLIPLLKQQPSIRFIIAGDGPETKALNKYVIEQGIDKQVLFYGRYQRHELQQLCSICKLFLVTSTTEVLPTTPLEAMLGKLPVLAINDLAFNYICKNDYNGYIGTEQELAQRAEELFNNPKKLSELSKNAYNTAQKHLSRDLAQEYIKTYQDLINNYEKKHAIKTMLIGNLLNAKLDNLGIKSLPEGLSAQEILGQNKKILKRLPNLPNAHL
jgi:1,2-diacylglycerol 3-alpha-glucosyltransferase